MVALTHVHGDHNGVAKDVCEARGMPLTVHADDVKIMERGGPTREELVRLARMGRAGPPVDRVLTDGDEVGGFRVIHARKGELKTVCGAAEGFGSDEPQSACKRAFSLKPATIGQPRVRFQSDRMQTN